MLSTPITFSDGSNPVGIWLELHSSERQWRNTYLDFLNNPASNPEIALRAIASQHAVLSNLSGFPAERWRQLCDGQGWTPLGCSALSWCGSTVNLGEIVERAKIIDWKISPEIGGDFAALMINPAAIPSASLSALLRAGWDDFAIALVVASRPAATAPEFDERDRSLLGPLVRQILELRT
ncbi:hypothetical protein GAO09_04520 [Rhizobiales bacterium RZME27]|uniref:Uncharacterized protein n=1 Tax=Endobacterium cereale TaxID=2663029 RepID=A0A6A8A3I3_9HYPH|nr:hypothetical protein [Endobacterium cereale]MQY45329.1 hypothetical protein [Endobacterium cereale]